ncbi:TrbG/VirB9 family P-type conjugative transfer protein [Rhizobium ruizarguesonis]
MSKRNTLFLLACGLAAPALAAPAAQPVGKPAATVQAPAEKPADPRIRRFAYSENSVYRLDLNLKSVTAVQFADGEEVQSILIGDSSSWEVVKLKSGNVVSIKPIIASTTTNMTIYTDKRVYTFDLHSLGEATSGAEATNLLRTVFTYPEEKKPAAEPVTESGPVNSDYLVSGKARFRPAWAQDNGRQTTFFMPPGAPRPAIFKVGPDGKEALVNSRTRGNQVVVDGTSDYWVLRIGDQSVCVGSKAAIGARRGFFGRLEVSRAGQ